MSIYVNQEAAEAFRRGAAPLPEGTLVVKEEFADQACTERQGWSIMTRERESSGSLLAIADWRWQRVDAQRKVVKGSDAACRQCHSACAEHDYVCVERGAR